MNLKNRKTLKEYFKKGKMPAEASFESLIDSMVNRIDDGFSKDLEHGLLLSPEGSSKQLLSFFRSIEQKNPAWSIGLDPGDAQKGLSFSEPGPDGGVRLFLQQGGNIGIGTIEPMHLLHVNGLAGFNGRVGTFAAGTIPADGKWHDVLTDLNGCQAFEVTARAGSPGQGRYALLQANALSTFGRSKSSIHCQHAHYGWFWNKLCLRWKGTTYSYQLQLRTRRNYGKDRLIHFHISKLWGDEEMGFALTATT
ncbi:MAG: hypothetical protein ACK5Z2_14465 [Bacteroidota bacterium]|jgi:hypothetical protein